MTPKEITPEHLNFVAFGCWRLFKLGPKCTNMPQNHPQTTTPGPKMKQTQNWSCLVFRFGRFWRQHRLVCFIAIPCPIIAVNRPAECSICPLQALPPNYHPRPKNEANTKIPRNYAKMHCFGVWNLAHQNRTIAIASNFRVDGAKSPGRNPAEGRSFGLRNCSPTFQRLSIAPLNRNAALLSLVSEIAAISGVRDGHRNRKSQKSLRFRYVEGLEGVFVGWVWWSVEMNLGLVLVVVVGYGSTRGNQGNGKISLRCVQLAGNFSTKFLRFPRLTAPSFDIHSGNTR